MEALNSVRCRCACARMGPCAMAPVCMYTVCQLYIRDVWWVTETHAHTHTDTDTTQSHTALELQSTHTALFLHSGLQMQAAQPQHILCTCFGTV
jgi:hypothetical protein